MSFKADSPIFEVIAVAYQRYGELELFVLSWINQSFTNWKLRVIHDGPDEQFMKIMTRLSERSADKIEFECTTHRYNDYGHSLRERGLRKASGDYVLLTNADNYYVPHTVRFLTGVALHSEADVLLFNMVHSHTVPGGRDLPPYSFFDTRYERFSLDIGCAAVRRKLACEAGFKDKTHDGDATYFEDVARAKSPESLSIWKIPQIFLVHN
jgi:hypothetical protein